jgi:energy-coupling factor transporter ATP-binding protein EcfA2
MPLELNTPGDIYQRINDELFRIVDSLDTPSNDTALNQSQNEARALLTQCQTELQSQLSELERNAEWNTFTIAFYGETGSGKSTIIETLRILLQEPSKLASQQAFRELQGRYGLSEENLQQLQHAIEQAGILLSELAQQLSATLLQHEQLHSDALNTITRLQALIAERKKTASLWQKLLNLFKKMPEEKELNRAEQQLPNIVAARENATAILVVKQAEAEQNKLALEQQFQESESRLAELNVLADGEIIGDGRADFTRRTQRYKFGIDSQSFALLDLPGIEGQEDLILSEIEQAVQTAHAVFYVTNQAASPQTGDEQRKGTLEKIKAHLGAQTEVWTIFNKKITNPKHSLKGRPLTSEDENTSLSGLDEKMRETLGDHYREVFPLTALPAFLASTSHFAPISQNAKRRNKILMDFSPEELLEKSRLRAFEELLSEQLLKGSKAKITRANFHKANEGVNQVAGTLGRIQSDFAELSDKLLLGGQNAQVQITSSFNALEGRLESSGETLIDRFASSVRKEIYALIATDISNDYFKNVLRDKIDAQQEWLSKKLPEAMGEQIEHFQKNAEDILKRFDEQARELTDLYTKLNDTRLNCKFNLKIDLDNGLKLTNLLSVLAGGALLWWNPVGWVVIALGVIGLVFGLYKAVCGFFSSDYKKAQQRKSTEDNLRSITGHLRDSLHDGLKKALPEIRQKISLIEQALEAPAKQTQKLVHLLDHSVNRMKVLSRFISTSGGL